MINETNKKHSIFLLICIILFALSVIVIISNAIVSYFDVKNSFPNDDRRMTDELVAIVFVTVWMTIPSLGAELSFIRSTYKIIKYEAKVYIKICYIISASLAAIAFTFYFLVFFGLIRCVGSYGYDYSATVLFFIEWPAFIISFIIGSIPIKHTA